VNPFSSVIFPKTATSLKKPSCPGSSQLQRLTRANALGSPYDWSREIAFALADCDVVCLIWSQHTAASKWAAPEKSKKDEK